MGRRTLFLVYTLVFFWLSEHVLLPIQPHTADAAGAFRRQQEEAAVKQDFRMEFSFAIERFYRKTLIIDETGRCDLYVESNVEHREKPEIGQYQTSISPAEAEQLRERLLGLSDLELPKETVTIPPGVPLFEVVVNTEGETLSRTFDPHTVPKRYQVVGRRVTEIEQAAYDNIERGLRMAFSLSNQQVDRVKPISIRIGLEAIGNKPVTFYNPIAPPDDGFGRITLSGTRSDIEKAKLQFFHRQAHHFTKAEVQQRADNPFPIEETLLTLKGGNSTEVALQAVLDWPPGEYDVKVIMDTSGPTTPRRDKVIGRITTLPVKLLVSGESRSEDEGVKDYKAPAL